MHYSTAELLLLVRLIAAHVAADFLFQPTLWVNDRYQNKVRSPFLYLHILVVSGLTWIFAWELSAWPLVLFIGTTHLLIDLWKSYLEDTTVAFLADQLAHMLLLVAGWIFYTDSAMATQFTISRILNTPSNWIALLAFMLAVWPCGYLVAKATEGWRREIHYDEKEDLSGLVNAGTWIGRIERVLILALILLQQYQAIGFLIASKSIFRFSGISDKKQRREAEYILIGTLISFALGIGLGIATQAAMTALG